MRGSCFYWFLFLIFRFVMRRDVGGIGVADVLLVVLIADASQNAMTGGYTSLAEGAILVATLVGWNFLLDWAAFRYRWVERIVEPRPLPLIRAGRILHKNLRAEFLTIDELHSSPAPERRRLGERGPLRVPGKRRQPERPEVREQARRSARAQVEARPDPLGAAALPGGGRSMASAASSSRRSSWFGSTGLSR